MLHRRAAAWTFATGSRFLGRWLPSESRPADEPSRRREAPCGRGRRWGIDAPRFLARTIVIQCLRRR
eukprot:9382009-Pyramimonas_sp.AAC.1